MKFYEVETIDDGVIIGKYATFEDAVKAAWDEYWEYYDTYEESSESHIKEIKEELLTRGQIGEEVIIRAVPADKHTFSKYPIEF